MDELLGQGRGFLELLPACSCTGTEVVSGAGWPCGRRQPVSITPPCSRSMCDDAEQSQPAEALPTMSRIQTPLLSRFFTAASPAISIKNFGRGGRGHPHLQRPRADGGFPSPYPNRSEDPESVARIEEEETEDDESRASEPTMSSGRLGDTRPPEASETRRMELPLIRVEAPSSESIRAGQPEAWEP